MQIKSGTNNFHGSADWYHTDQNFAARNYFQTDTKLFLHKNRNNRNQFGGTFGGPIVKSRLFFFVDYERTTQRQLAGPDTRTLPTTDTATGDFRNLPGTPIIYDPMTGDAHGAGKQQISCNGVLNVICPSRIDPAATTMIGFLQPSIAHVFATANWLNNSVGNGTAEFNRDNFDAKVNYNIRENATIFGRYSFSKSLIFDPPCSVTRSVMQPLAVNSAMLPAWCRALVSATGRIFWTRSRRRTIWLAARVTFQDVKTAVAGSDRRFDQNTQALRRR